MLWQTLGVLTMNKHHRTETIEYLRHRGYSRKEAIALASHNPAESPEETWDDAPRFQFSVDFRPVRKYPDGCWLGFVVNARNECEARDIAARQLASVDNTRAYKVAKIIRHLDFTTH
ncbi:hypothetical protein CCP4SC76_5000006 [Gammaproteobacteria bacterium]